jgi:hypothetical protein
VTAKINRALGVVMGSSKKGRSVMMATPSPKMSVPTPVKSLAVAME